MRYAVVHGMHKYEAAECVQIVHCHGVGVSPCSCLAKYHQVGIANGQRPQAVISSKEAAVSCYSYI